MSSIITIAMATYNGARYLPPQLDSILAQQGVEWRLLVSDDGSTDGTLDILDGYARRHPGRIAVIQGPRQGATRNFLHLIAKADPRGWVAFADQDDLWRPGKLARAARWLEGQQGPAVYAARTTICDEDLRELAPAPHFPGPFGFRNALVQACLPGNTTVANGGALRLMQAAAGAASAADVISHDWWVYQLMSGAGAAIHRDAAQVVLYRQHRENLMGRNDTAKARAARLSMLFDGRFADWLARNQRALEPVADLLTQENRAILQRFGALLESRGPRALSAALALGLYRQTRAGSWAIRAAALAGRLRTRSPAPAAFGKAG